MTSIDFSDKIGCTSGPVPNFSPDRRHIAYAQDCRLVVRDIESLAVAGIFSCLDSIGTLAWSPDSDHIMCNMPTRGTIQVFSLQDVEWTCTISEGLAGVAEAKWSPDGQHIVLVADFQVKLSVWSLVDQSCIQLPAPKYPTAGLGFSPDGTTLAVIERTECKDFISMYEVNSWNSIARFPLPCQDAANLAWSPDSRYLAVWEGAAYGHRLLVITPTGECLADQSNYKEGLGVKSVEWSPSGQLLAVGTYEQGASVLESATWTNLATFPHAPTISGPSEVIVYQEVQEGGRVLVNSNGSRVKAEEGKAGVGVGMRSRPPSRTSSLPSSRNSSPTKQARPSSASAMAANNGRLTRAGSTRPPSPEDPEDAEPSVRSRYIIPELPLRLHAVRAAPDNTPSLKVGVSSTLWSADGTYIATKDDSMPNVVWIWHSASSELTSVLVQSHPVRSMCWDPSPGSARLAVASGAGRIYLWSPDGASCVHVPVPGMRATALEWNKDGSVLLLSGRDGYSCAYFCG